MGSENTIKPGDKEIVVESHVRKLRPDATIPDDKGIVVKSYVRNRGSIKPETAAVALANVGMASGALNPVAGAVVAAGSLLSVIYKALPVNKKIAAVEPVSDTWKNRPKANMVKWMMKQSGTSLEEIAAHLGCSVSYLNNKLTRESFSFEDLLLAAYACGYTFVLVNNNEEISSEDSFRVDLLKHFESEQEVLDRINAIEEEKKQAKRAEYEAKKAELARMKAEYGFED